MQHYKLYGPNLEKHLSMCLSLILYGFTHVHKDKHVLKCFAELGPIYPTMSLGKYLSTWFAQL